MKLKGNKQIKDEEGPKNRRNALVVALVGGVFALIVALIPLFNADKTTDTPQIQVDQNRGQVTKIEGDYYDNRNTIAPIVEEKSYSITGLTDISFINYIRKTTRLNISSSSDNELKITYSNEIKPLANSSDIFYYGGGHVIVKLNDIICADLTSMRIDELRPNSKVNIERTIAEIISRHVAQNKIYFKNEILKCVH